MHPKCEKICDAIKFQWSNRENNSWTKVQFTGTKKNKQRDEVVSQS